jgi:hypothetical protein
MKREYYLAETLDALDQAITVLHNGLDIKDKNIHIISNNTSGLKEHHLHSANIIYKSDVIRGAEQGLVYGVLIGIMFFAMAAFGAPFWEVSFSVKQMILLIIFSSPLILGVLAGAFIGVLKINYRLTLFDNEISKGHHLMLVDSENVEEIRQVLKGCPIIDVGETGTLILPFDEVEDSLLQVA